MKKGRKLLLTLGFLIALTVLLCLCAYASEVGIGRVTGGSVNVRALPALTSARLTQLTKGTDVLILGCENNFYQISIEGKVGYMSTDYVKRQADQKGEFGYARLTASMMLSEAPEQGRMMGLILNEGQGVKVQGTENGWFVVQLGGTKGYLPAGSLNPVTPTAEMIAEYAAHAPGRVVVETAMKYLGIRYLWGGSTPKTGFDCSGLVQYVYQESLNFQFTQRTSLYRDGQKVARTALLPGDLVTFSTQGGRGISHIGIYVGDGKFIHAPRRGTVVRVEEMTSGYYATRFHSAYRVV